MEIAKQIPKLTIKKKYINFINDFKTNIIALLGDNLHSMYICGSIATGSAKPYKSDADFTIVTKNKLTESEQANIKNLNTALLHSYPFITKIDTPSCTIDDVKERSWGLWIKVVSYCIYGKDLGANVPPLTPDANLIIGLNTDTRIIIEGKMKVIKNTDNKKKLKLLNKKIARKLIRALFTLVIVKEQTWTDNIKHQVIFLHKNYTGEKAIIKSLYKTYKKPSTDRDKILSFFQKAIDWFNREYEQVIKQQDKPTWQKVHIDPNS